MTESRRDPLLGHWTLFPAGRHRRRQLLPPAVTALAPHDPACPFCVGNERFTTQEIARFPADAAPGAWQVRVVPNRTPLLRVEGNLLYAGDGPYDRIEAVGAHEVFIESPLHHRGMADLTTPELDLLLQAMQTRMLDLARDGRLRALCVFKNHGADAGAPLMHGHTQLVALPFVPPALAALRATLTAHRTAKRRSLFDDVVREELAHGTRLVDENGDFVALSPYAARVPFETWILPKREAVRFEHETPHGRALFAQLLSRVLGRLDRALERPAYNAVLVTRELRPDDPVGDDDPFRWHAVILPRLFRTAGFDWGSGCHVNPVPPEEAAAYLRGL